MARLIALLAVSACGTAVPSGLPTAPTPGAPAAPPIELVETVPIETTLDHTEIRDASDVWLEMIAAARTTIDLAEFYVSNAPHSRLGTGNWERDYFYNSRNLGILIDDPKLAAQLHAFFATAWQSPYAQALDPDATYAAPRIE